MMDPQLAEIPHQRLKNLVNLHTPERQPYVERGKRSQIPTHTSVSLRQDPKAGDLLELLGQEIFEEDLLLGLELE